MVICVVIIKKGEIVSPFICKVLMIANPNVLVNMLCLSCIVETESEKYLDWTTSVFGILHQDSSEKSK